MRKLIQRLVWGITIIFFFLWADPVGVKADVPVFTCFKADDVMTDYAYRGLTQYGASCNRILYKSAQKQSGFSGLTVTWSGVNNEEFQKNPAYFYQLVLTDLLQEQRSFDITSENLENSLNTIQMKLEDKAEEIWQRQDVQEIVASSVTLSALQDLYEGYLTAQEVKSYFEELQKMLTQEGYWVGWLNAKLGDIQGVFDSIVALKNVNENRIEVYKKMRSCTDNSLMIMALNNLISQYESQSDLIFDTAIQYGVDKITDGCLNYAKESAKAALTSMGLAPLMGGYQFGKFVSNQVFGADAISESYLIMKTTVEVEDVMRKAVKSFEEDYQAHKSPETASVFLESVDMLLSMAYYGVDASDAFVYVTLEDNLASFVQNTFFPNNEKASYSEWKEVLNFQREIVEDWERSFKFIYDSYRFIYVKDNRLNHNVTEEEKEQIINSVEYQEALKEAKTPTIDEDTTLFMDLTYEGDLLISGGTVDLNGFTMTVKGDLYQPEGSMMINGGVLNIEGDYLRYTEEKNLQTGEVEKRGSNGYLKMNTIEDTVIVGGDYVTYVPDTGYSGLSDELYVGQLIVQGNFHHLGGDLDFGENCSLIFDGIECPELSMEADLKNNRDTIKLSHVEFKTGKVVFKGKMIGFSLQQDLEVLGDFPIFSGGFDLNGFTMTVKGDLYQPEGSMMINGGVLNIEGDYLRYTEEKNLQTGEVEKRGSNGYLKMNTIEDTVIVGGDYVTYVPDTGYSGLSDELYVGQLIVQGNFHHLGGDLDFGENCSLIFDGIECPELSMEADLKNNRDTIRLSHVEFKTGKVVFKGEMIGFSLQQDLEVVGDFPIFSGGFDLNGFTMTVKGDLYQPEGSMMINGGALNIEGAYLRYTEEKNPQTGEVEKRGSNRYLKMNTIEDTVIVGGDYITYVHETEYGGLSDELNAGQLVVQGSFHHLGGDLDFGENCSLIFDGIECPELSMEADLKNNRDTIKFSHVEFKTGKVIFKGKMIGFSLQQDLEVLGDFPIFSGGFDLNGFTMTVKGDLYQPEGTMMINGGTLNIEGDYLRYTEEKNTQAGTIEKRASTGYLKMNTIEDTVIVDGDYVTHVYATGYVGVYDELNAGQLVVRGSFHHLGGDLDFGENCSLIFDGIECPELSMEADLKNNRDTIKLSHVEFKTGKVIFKGKMIGLSLQQDLEVVGDFPIFTGIFDLNGYTMNILGDLYQPTGIIKLNKGNLIIEGNYELYTENINSMTDVLEKFPGGTLEMNNQTEKLVVYGDYVTYGYTTLNAGIMTIKGDFQHLGNTFSPGDLFQIVFAEKAVPNVSFASTSGRFNKVEFKTGNVSMSGKVTGFVLQHDLTVVGEMPAFTGTFDLNGHTMNIQESFTQPSGTFKVNRGTLNIAKDWNLCGIKINEMTDEEEIIQGGSVLMQNVKDKVNVGGNLTTYSSNSSDSLKAGTLTLGGNLEQYGHSYSFYATQLHKTILTGGASTEKPQIINFRNTNCRFQTLQLAKDRSYYQFNPDNCWQELVADEPLSIADAVLSLSAESFQYDGTEKKPEVTVVLGGTTLTADQDYTLAYENNTEVGTAKVTITGIGLYQGTVEKEFTITCEHQWGESITKEPTCQEEGEKTITCEICGQTKTEKIEKADHQYGEWTVAKEPTKDTDGERKRACIWCGLEETEVIPALGWETVPDGTTVISEGAFQGNTTIREIILPDSLKEIQANAFENCGNLERVVLPEGVVAIGDGAFQNCPNLQEVVIPKIVTQIGTDAFKGCPNLIIFGEEGSFAQTYAEENGISFTVFQKNDLASCRWEVPGEFTYNGEEHRPEVKLFLAEKQLVHGIDYTVAYENNLNAGEAYINVTGIRTFQGVLKIPFVIQKAARPVQPEETVTKLYTDAPFKLETEGDGIFQYEVSNPQIAEVSSDGTVTIKAAGKTEIVIKEAETENYLERESAVALTVNPAPIRVSGILAQDKVFDGTTKAVLVTDQVVFEGKKENDQLSVEAQGSFVDANAGTGKTVLISGMKLVGTQSGNYVLDTAGQQQDAKASITKAHSVYSGRTEFTGTVGQSLSEITSGSGLTVAEYVFDQVGSFTNQAIYCPDSRNYEPQKGIAITIQITCDSHTGGKADCMHRAVCEKCGQEYGETDPNGHQYTEVVTKPTCTEGGYTTYTCRICQTSYQGNETKPAGHQLKDGVCTVCGYMELPAVGTTVTVGSLKYKIVSSADEKQEVEVTASVKKNLTSIEIPSVVKISGGDYQVVSIASKAFQNCTNLKKVTIGANVRSIGSSAFAGCRKLTSISTKNVQEIGSSAFSGCSSLKKAVTGTALQKIGNNAFYNCKALTSMTIGRNVNSIGSKAFANCTKLRKAVIGSKVKKINTNTFYGCKSLTSVTIGNNVTSIGNGAFKNCSKLRKVTIPVKVKSIGKDAFRNSKNLKSVVIRGTALKSVGKNAFKGVDSRAVVKVPKKKLKAYQKLLKNKGLSKTAKISK